MPGRAPSLKLKDAVGEISAAALVARHGPQIDRRAGRREALVATAVGILVAIPAVVAFNYFSRRVRVRMTDVDWLAHIAAEDVQADWASTGDDEPLRRSA